MESMKIGKCFAVSKKTGSICTTAQNHILYQPHRKTIAINKDIITEQIWGQLLKGRYGITSLKIFQTLSKTNMQHSEPWQGFKTNLLKCFLLRIVQLFTHPHSRIKHIREKPRELVYKHWPSPKKGDPPLPVTIFWFPKDGDPSFCPVRGGLW